MPEAPFCPHCGAPIRPDAGAIEEAREEKPGVPAEGGDLPPIPLLAPGSQDDNFLAGSSFGSRIGPVEPDPVLGEFVTPTSGPSSASGMNFPALDLESSAGVGTAHPPGSIESDGDAEGDEPEARPSPWATVLLASYASAVTLGLGWILLKDRSRPGAESGSPSATQAAESARQSGLSRKVGPPEPILGDHFAEIGKPIRVGALEVTPVDVKRQGVALQRTTSFATPERKEGGKGALVLRLKLKNTSVDSAFAPLDQAYLRERGRGIVDTFLETVDGERIYPFPLAVDSEWSIVGQPFDELRPGESRVVAIASAPDAPPDSSGPFTWRVRLRTGVDRTDVIGLRWPSGPAADRPRG